VRWILDDMAFDDIARVVPPGDLSAWPNDELVLADATAQAAALDPSGRRQAVLAARSGATGAAIIESFTVTVGSTAGTILYTHLRTGSGGSANLAEHQSIAWALTDPVGDSVLVTQDKLAALLALAELGRGRVCHPYELWEQLLSKGLLTQQQFQDLMGAASRRDKSIPAIPWRLQPHP
jgi:hypothetical protein